MTAKMFMGSSLCVVETDGGVILPSFIRDALGARSDGSALLLGSHETDTCLIGYDPGQAMELQEECRRRRIAEEGSRPGASHARARRLFGLLHNMAIDQDGRCILPDLLRRRARIRDAALIVGTGEAFELWSVDVALYGHDAGMRTLASLSLEISQAA
jgi:DNA-binding transcriptional regulator/RsmH inhibitor MraZ